MLIFNINVLSKLNLQQSKNVTVQKSFWFLHEKIKFIIATKNLNFFASSSQFKNDVIIKFNEFK